MRKAQLYGDKSNTTSHKSHPLTFLSSKKTIMFDPHEHRHVLAEADNYLGKSNFAVNSLEWRSAKNSHSIFHKEDEENFEGIIVGNIGSYRLNVSPCGNYISSQYGSLAKAKYQLHLTCPITSPFREDYNRAYQVLVKLQDIAAVKSKGTDMLFDGAGGQTIRMTKNIFEKRVRYLHR